MRKVNNVLLKSWIRNWNESSFFVKLARNQNYLKSMETVSEPAFT